MDTKVFRNSLAEMGIEKTVDEANEIKRKIVELINVLKFEDLEEILHEPEEDVRNILLTAYNLKFQIAKK